VADLDRPRLVFDGGCPDGGRREVKLPQPLPAVGDDFDWRTRDFDGFRMHMLEDLAARFPERARWTRADVEVVIVEALAAALDQLSDMTDRVFAEAYLETARRPESVLRLLGLLGHDPSAGPGDPAENRQALIEAWANDPAAMESERREGRRRIGEQQRMVTLEDFAARLQEHPIVERAHAYRIWSGAWWIIRVVVSLFEDSPLDNDEDDRFAFSPDLRGRVDAFHASRGLPPVAWGLEGAPQPSARAVLQPYLDAYRMLGQPAELQGVIPVGIVMQICLRLDEDYFKSEIERAVRTVLGRGPGQFFEPGRLKFGESLFASDIFQALGDVEGVVDVSLTQFKRLGERFSDQSSSGLIPLSGLEIARCDNDPANPRFGSFRLTLHGGRGG
jgi:hypothetical protein